MGSRGNQEIQHFEVYGIPVTAMPAGGRTWEVIVNRSGTSVATITRVDSRENGSKNRWYVSANHPQKRFRTIEDATNYLATQWRNGH